MHVIQQIALAINDDREFLSKQIALDLGANHGHYTVPMAEIFGHVYAFEPDPDNFGIMINTLTGKENVTPIQAAISDVHGTIKLYKNPGNVGGHTISDRAVVEAGQGHSFDVFVEAPAYTLDEFCEDMPVYFIKCDVEAAEGFIFNGAVKFLTEQSPIISLETHRELDHGALSEFFRNLGYTIFENNTPIEVMRADSVYLIRKL